MRNEVASQNRKLSINTQGRSKEFWVVIVIVSLLFDVVFFLYIHVLIDLIHVPVS